MFPGQCGNTAFFFKSQPDQFHFEFRGIVFPGKSFFSAHEVSTCKISGCLSYRILDSGPDGTQTTLTLKATYRRAKTITLIVDNYIIHKSRETQRWLKANPKFRVIYQPVYSPWVNHVERLWQALHDTITRNHQCRSMWQLLKKVRHFMETASPFPGGKHGQAKV